MVLRGQAEWKSKRVLCLRSEGIPHPCLTRICVERDPIFDAEGDRIYPRHAAIGRSQKYARTPINKPVNFKFIHSSDRGPFIAALTGYEYDPLPKQ